ncbi:MAG TPA: hypothetical protein VGN72_23815 [Tepidisphaeraceae bacterium]|nr:hypothetical protein [Tepidisphaeraceae bacterium]
MSDTIEQTVTAETAVPLASLAYHTGDAGDSWWVGASLVGRLAFWYGLLSGASILVETAARYLMNDGPGWSRFGIANVTERLVYLLYTGGSIVGAGLLAVGGRGVKIGNPDALRSMYYGAICVGTTYLLEVAHGWSQFYQGGAAGTPAFHMVYYVASSVIGTAAYLILPTFFFFFATNSSMRRREESVLL